MAVGQTADTPPHIGIDFGTSKCVMTWYNPQTGQPEILRNAEGEDKTPSVVYYGEDGVVLVGKPALAMLNYEEERANVILSVKRNLAKLLRYPIPGSPTPVDVAAAILSKLKADAETGRFHHAALTTATITYPAAFGVLEQEKLREAAACAGFAAVTLLEEPVAAARAYATGQRAADSILVFDLGAGTFDLALLARDAAENAFFVALPPQGLRIGGDDFDRALYDHCDALARQQLGRGLSLDDLLDADFLLNCRQNKENLTTGKTSRFAAFLSDPDGGIVKFRHEVSRETFEALIGPTVEKTVRGTQALVAQARAQGHAIGSIVLIGGSSRVPLVRELLRAALPDLPAPQQWDQMDYAVALGAALPLPAPAEQAPVSTEPAAGEPAGAPQTGALPDNPGSAAPPATSNNEGRNTPAAPLFDEQSRAEIKELKERLDRALARMNHVPALQIPDGPGSMPPVSDQPKGVGTAEPASASIPHKVGEIRQFTGHGRRINCVAFSPDGRYALSGCNDKNPTFMRLFEGGTYPGDPKGNLLVLWDVATGKRVRDFPHLSQTITSVTFSRDGEYALASYEGGAIYAWRIEDGVRNEQSLVSLYNSEWRLSPDGTALLSIRAGVDINSPKRATLNDWQTGEQKCGFEISRETDIQRYHVSRADFSSAFSPDGQFVVILSKSMTAPNAGVWITLCRASNGEILKYSKYTTEIPGASSRPNLTFLPDGKSVLLAHGNKLLLWNIDSWAVKDVFSEETGGVINDFSVSADGQRVLSVGVKGSHVLLWDVPTRKVIWRQTHLTTSLNCVALSPDGRFALYGGDDGILRLIGLPD